MQYQCIPKIVIYNTVFNATPFTCFVNTKRVADFNVLLTAGKVKKTSREMHSDISKSYLQMEKMKQRVNLQHFPDNVSKIPSKFQCSLCFKRLAILGGRPMVVARIHVRYRIG